MAVNVSDPLDGLGIHLKVGDEVVQQLGYGYSLRNRSGVGAPVDLLKPLPQQPFGFTVSRALAALPNLLPVDPVLNPPRLEGEFGTVWEFLPSLVTSASNWLRVDSTNARSAG